MLVWPFFLLSEEVRRPLIMTPITSPSPGEGACSAAFPPWTASRIRERLGAFLHDGSLASWAGPHVLRRAADGTPFVGGTAIRQLAAGAVLPEREVMVALLQDGIWPERFRRNYGVFSADAMVRLLQTRVFVLGCGGLGGHVASLLARLGVGGLRLCDSDIFEESNLNRQYFCTESTLGQPKAVATARGLRDMAGYLALDVRHVEADEKNLPDMLQNVDVALDCLDDLALKMLLEERSAAAGVPFVHGSVLRAEGFARAFRAPASAGTLRFRADQRGSGQCPPRRRHRHGPGRGGLPDGLPVPAPAAAARCRGFGPVPCRSFRAGTGTL